MLRKLLKFIYQRTRRMAMSTKRDEMVLSTIRQVIKEVKQEMQNKKVLTEGKTAQEVFDRQEHNMRNFITENVLKVLKISEQ